MTSAIAVAKYAKAHPKKTFVNGTAGALDTTMIVRAPNFFRWNGDGAQWNAGTGWVAYNVLGWRKVDVIMDDYSFGWTSAAGFIAEFCALGGEVTKRVFPPLNTTDYSQYVAQLDPPNAIDGYFWAVGGTGTLAALKAFEQKFGQHQRQAAHGQPVLRHARHVHRPRPAHRRLVRGWRRHGRRRPVRRAWTSSRR